MPRRVLTFGAGALWAALPSAQNGPLVTIDRIEDDVAVVEWTPDTIGDLPLNVLPPDTREGDRLHLQWQRVDRHPVPVQSPPARSPPTSTALAPTRVQLRALPKSPAIPWRKEHTQ